MENVTVNKEKSVAKRETPSLRRASDMFSPMIPFGRQFGLNPFALMREFTEEMDRVFRGVLPWPESGAEENAWSPALDIQHCNGDLVITAELPGLKKDEVKVQLTDDAIVISR